MKRIYYIDWLRILGIGIIFFFHSTSFFHSIDWHVKNPDQTEASTAFFRFILIWIMPLFFFLSGGLGIFGVQKPFTSFLTGKALRLLVPLAVGILLLIPPQKYVEALSHNAFSGGYSEFLAGYFTGPIFPWGINPSWVGWISLHLWFLFHLLVISVLLFPVLRLLDGKGGALMDTLHKFTSFSGGALLLFLPIALSRVLLRQHFPDYTGWSDLSVHAICFLLGFIYTRHEGLKQNLVASRYVALPVAVVLSALYVASFRTPGTWLGELYQSDKVYGFYVFQQLAGALATWSWLVFVAGMGIRHLNHDARYRQPLNEAVLPFYILHQTVLILIGYFVVQWPWPMLGKWLFISATSLVVIVALYRFGIKPFNVVRYLFGMGNKPGKRAAAPEPVLEGVNPKGYVFK